MPQDPLDYSTYYNTPIPKEKQAGYQQFIKDFAVKNGGRNLENDKYDYDVNGLYLSGDPQAANGHFTDKFKKPNHPTFSDESQYNGHEGNIGGHWGSNQFQVSPTNLKFRNQNQINDYFKQTEPDFKPVYTPKESAGVPQKMPGLMDFFAQKLLGKAAEQGAPAVQVGPPANLNIGQMAQQSAAQKLGPSAGVPFMQRPGVPIPNEPNYQAPQQPMMQQQPLAPPLLGVKPRLQQP